MFMTSGGSKAVAKQVLPGLEWPDVCLLHKVQVFYTFILHISHFEIVEVL
jgi:hypothetical protein